jgi:phage terminase Nu1 subunit (DNA packaging protein)
MGRYFREIAKGAKMPEKLVDTKELCEYFGVTRQAVEQWRKKGMPVVVDSPHGTKRYYKSKVIAWHNKRNKIKAEKSKKNLNG